MSIPLEFVSSVAGEDVAAILDSYISKMAEVLKLSADIAKEGDRANDVFARQRISVAAASEAFGHQVEEIDLVIQANRTHLAGLQVTAEQYGNMARVAREFAEAQGIEMTEALETLTSAIIRGNERGLRPFGLEAGTTADILRQVRDQADQLGPSIEGVGDAVARLQAQSHSTWEEFERGIDSSEALASAVGTAADGTSTLGHAAHIAGEALGETLGKFTLLGFILNRIHTLSGLAGDGLEDAGARGTRAGNEVAEAWRQASIEVAHFGKEGALDVGLRAVGTQYTDVSYRPGGRGDVGLTDRGIDVRRRGRRRGPQATNEGRAEFARAMGGLNTAEAELEAQKEADRAEIEQIHNHTDAVQDAYERRREMDEKNAEARFELAQRQLEQQREWHQHDLEEEERFAEARKKALLADVATAGQLSGMAAELLGLSEADKLVVLGISEAAQSAASFAVLNFIGGAMHGLASAIAFKGAVDVRAANQRSRASARAEASAGGGGGGGGVGAGGAFGTTSGGGAGGAGGGTVIYQYNFGGTLAGRRDLDDFIHEAELRNHARGRKVA